MTERTNRTRRSLSKLAPLFLGILLLALSSHPENTITTALSFCTNLKQSPALQTSSSKLYHLLEQTTAIRQNSEILTMRVQRRASKTARAKGSKILRENEERMKNAGHRGQKHFVNPNKLFVGNLDYRVTQADLMEFFRRCGVSSNIQELKIVTDWRSGDSKGYGFVVFREPIQATSALTHIVGRKLMGRVVNLNQGEKKRQKTIYLVKRDKSIPVIEDAEDDVIATAIGAKGEAEVDTNVDLDVSELIEFQHETEDTVNGLLEKVGMGDSLLQKTSDEIFVEEYESNDDLAGYEYDGNYDDELKDYYLKQAAEQAAAEGAEEEEPMNREQRRIAASRWRKKIRKGPGFGNGYDYQTDTHTDNPYEGRNIMDVEDFEAQEEIL